MIQVTLPRGDLDRLDQIIAQFQADSEEAPAGAASEQVTIYIFPTSNEQENATAERIAKELERADWTIYPDSRAG
jgi:hypothetical protein